MKRNNIYNIKCHPKTIIIALLLLAGNIFCHAQNPNKIERKQLFDYNWKFYLGITAAGKSKDFNDINWRALDLPHDWSIKGGINAKNPTRGAGGCFPAGIGWYRKTSKVPNEWKGKKFPFILKENI